jgi:hypothetical protein
LTALAACAEAYTLLAYAKGGGNKCDQTGIGFAVCCRCRDSDFEPITVLPREFIGAGLGLNMAE